ncbi:transcriptional regulator [Planobispora longispora]|uniref:Uncharacterized protein n=1 Tax=Planobispora longispora TaxID=28887 RepID=A0A8J3RVX9_9ACTN|nr:transcriptional regulator [Planobispora longispora]GIH80922.1 hypothetical protein Plo01_73510 [Planobispora longispora]
MENNEPAAEDRGPRIQAGTGYPIGQLATAFVTALIHADEETRRRAEGRLRRWESVLRGMVSGTLSIGSRKPVAGLPVWATPQVVRGGFATGEAAAGGPLRPHEEETVRRAGLARDRRSVFAHHLTEPGLTELDALLDGGGYRMEVPEEAALPVVAWLVRAGDVPAALALLEEIGPYADRLRFAPAPADVPRLAPDVVWRETAGDARDALARRGPNDRIETMREALTVWNPLADEMLALWLETAEDGRVARVIGDEWLGRAAALLDRYRALAAAHPRCAKHRKPKENLAILRSSLEEVVAGRALSPRARGLLQHAVDAMLRRRGRPGSAPHSALRRRQADDASVPAHHTLARIVVGRLADLPQDRGVRSADALTGPVTAEEAAATGVPAGAAVPEAIRHVVRRSLAGTVEELIAAGVVPSAEVLARLIPQIAAAVTAAAYPDDALRSLMAANYRAFRNRRSLLLLDLERQVQIEELPWVRAVSAYRDSGGEPGEETSRETGRETRQETSRDSRRRDAGTALRRLGELALDGFPGTLPPNPLIRELAALGREAGQDLPWVEELAADIFTGSFSAKFPAAAKVAGELLGGSLYERYYGIDYRAVRAIADTRPHDRYAARTSRTFDGLCLSRSGAPQGSYSVAANGMVIEQAQILTTHNLATLVHRVGVRPAAGWRALADRAFTVAARLTSQLEHNPRPLSTIKDVAYAWRHMVFFMSLPGAGDPRGTAGLLSARLSEQPPGVRDRLAPALAGLVHVAAGGSFAPGGTADGGGRRLLGWSAGAHWLRPATIRRNG